MPMATSRCKNIYLEKQLGLKLCIASFTIFVLFVRCTHTDPHTKLDSQNVLYTSYVSDISMFICKKHSRRLE